MCRSVTHQILCSFILSAFSLFCMNLTAKDGPSEANWYRVEILVFKNMDPAATKQEQWPHRPQLYYPTHAQHLEAGPEYAEALINLQLIDLSPADKGLSLFSTLAATDKKNPLLSLKIDMPEPAVKIPADIDTEISDQMISSEELRVRKALPTEDTWPTKDDSIELNNANEADKLMDESQLDQEAPVFVELTIPRAYALLPRELREFNDYSQKMSRSRYYQVLHHSSWRQPIVGRKNSRSIIIESDPLDRKYPELQGTIELSVSRYLHVRTLLWLNMEELVSVDSEPRVTPPLAPEHYSEHWRFEVPLDRFATDDRIEVPGFYGKIQSSDSQKAPDIETGVPSKEALPRLQADYVYSGPVLMNQQRRMRSREQHYIDHPLFGLIIKITPYNFESFINEEELSRLASFPEKLQAIP